MSRVTHLVLIAAIGLLASSSEKAFARKAARAQIPVNQLQAQTPFRISSTPAWGENRRFDLLVLRLRNGSARMYALNPTQRKTLESASLSSFSNIKRNYKNLLLSVAQQDRISFLDWKTGKVRTVPFLSEILFK